MTLYQFITVFVLVVLAGVCGYQCATLRIMMQIQKAANDLSLKQNQEVMRMLNDPIWAKLGLTKRENSTDAESPSHSSN